jgi:hypothetical protein
MPAAIKVYLRALILNDDVEKRAELRVLSMLMAEAFEGFVECLPRRSRFAVRRASNSSDMGEAAKYVLMALCADSASTLEKSASEIRVSQRSVLMVADCA